MARSYDTEKATVEPSDFAGLEVVHPPRIGHGSPYNKPLPAEPVLASGNGASLFAEMSNSPTAGFPHPPASSSSEYDPATEKVPINIDQPVAQSAGSKYTRRKRLKILALVGIIFVIVAVAAVVGGVVGTRHNGEASDSDSTPSSTPGIPSTTASPEQMNAQLGPDDIMVGSPLTPVSFDANSEDGLSTPGRNMQLFYQNGQSYPQQLKRKPNGDWSRLQKPMLTDTSNNTGLAAINCLNGTTRQTSLFYISPEGTIREKRLYPDQADETWHLGTIHHQKYQPSGKSGYDDAGEPKPSWGGLQIAAIYSTNFSSGAGARLFYHRSNSSDDWIQEAIWYQGNDSWAEGSRIYGSLPSAHLSVVIDPPTQALRLFYATSNHTVSESWYNITDSSPSWASGTSIDDVLTGPSVDFTTITTSTDTILYYTSAQSAESNITIQELILPSPMGKTAATSSSSQVAMPALMANNTNSKLHSLYAPLGAVFSPADDDEDASITVFWAENTEGRESGYHAMRSLSRTINTSWNEKTVESLPVDKGG